MDWSKAKNILIVAFIITNIFLIYNIEKDMFNKDALEARSQSKIKEVVQILKERGIEIDTEVPMEVMGLPVLDVEYIIYDLAKMQNLFLMGQSNEEAELTLSLNNKVLYFKRNVFLPNSIALNEKQARQEAEKFLKKYSFMSNDVVYWNYELMENQYKIYFKQKYKGRILEHSYMLLTVSDLGVIDFERMWLKPLKFGGSKLEIIPSPKALLKYIEEHEYTEEDTTITHIDLVYWLDLSPNSFTSWEDVESGTAIPAWRIELNNGETTFIPAFEEY